jgi:hypothetical protein
VMLTHGALLAIIAACIAVGAASYPPPGRG